MKMLFRICAGILIIVSSAILALYLMTRGNYNIPQTLPHNKNIPVISAGDRIFHGETFGSPKNPLLIVLHGGPGGDYRNLLALKGLADQYFVIFYDQAGSGLSPRQDQKTIDLDSTMTDLDLIVKKFRKKRPINIIGHNWGAMVASAYTGKHPEKVDHLILAEPGFLTPEKAQEFIFKTRPPMTPGALWFLIKTWFKSRHLADETGHERYDYIMGQMTTGFSSSDHPLSGYFCNREQSPSAKTFWRFGFTAWKDIITSVMDSSGNVAVSFTEGITVFNKKVLFLVGECNIITGKKYQEDHIKLFKNAEFAVIPSAGHLMLGENPEISIQVIKKFLGN